MGYTTDFTGEIEVTPPLNADEISFLTELSGTRRMKRTRGPLYAHDDGNFGQGAMAGNGDKNATSDVLEYNTPDASQPSLWLQWVPSEDGKYISWNEAEKFYSSAEWMKYIINNLFSSEAIDYVMEHANASQDKRLLNFTFNHVFNGEIEAQGEDSSDRWLLVVENNKVFIKEAQITWKEPVEI